MPEKAALRQCPYCKEEIKPDAIRCKHCRSSVPPEKPPHGGTCPYCKEAIHAEAIKCKHCGAMLGPEPGGPCCGGCGGAAMAGAPASGFMRSGEHGPGGPSG